MDLAVASDLTAIPRWSSETAMDSYGALSGAGARPTLYTLSRSAEPTCNFFNYRIRIPPVLGDFRGEARQITVGHRRASFLEQGVTQHFEQTHLPVLRPAA